MAGTRAAKDEPENDASDKVLIKYMGISDRHTLLPEENFSGRLAEPIGVKIVFDNSNNFVVDVKEAGLSDEAIELLAADPSFKDVSKLKRIPSNLNQSTYRALDVESSAGKQPPVAHVSDELTVAQLHTSETTSTPEVPGAVNVPARSTSGD